MGLDLTQQAFPDDFILLKLLKERPEIGGELCFCERYWREGLRSIDRDFKLSVEVFSALQDLKLSRPGIDRRNFYFRDRDYDVVCYVLEKAAVIQGASNQPRVAIYGDRVINPAATTGQGSYRFTSEAKAKEVLDFLHGVDIRTACSLIVDCEMAGQAYKAPDCFDDDEKKCIQQSFIGLASFYEEVVRNKEGVLCYTW